MDPTTKTLIRVRIDDAAQAERRVTTLMGDKVEPRRKGSKTCSIYIGRRWQYFRSEGHVRQKSLHPNLV